LAIAQDYVSVEWHLGLRNFIHGVEKNFFAGAQFRIWVVAIQVCFLLGMNVLPFVGLFFGYGWIRALAAVSVLIGLCFHAGVDLVMRVPVLYCLTLPLGAAVMAYMILRSTVVTLRQGGVVWRDTFYSLEELRRGMV
jgi:hypothetical protein